MGLLNKGITKAVKEEFIKGVHEYEAMLVKVAHLVTDEFGVTDANRKAYIIQLTKTLREQYGMEVKRSKAHGRKKTGATKKPTQLALDLRNKLHPNGLQSPADKAQEALNKLNALPEVVSKISTATLIRKYTGFYGDGDVTAYEHSVGFEPQPIVDIVDLPKAEDDITAEYVRLDDEHKVALKVISELKGRNERLDETNINLMNKIEEFKREITRLEVIISYLEGKK